MDTETDMREVELRVAAMIAGRRGKSQMGLLFALLAAKGALDAQPVPVSPARRTFAVQYGKRVTAVVHDELQEATSPKQRPHRHHNKRDRWT